MKKILCLIIYFYLIVAIQAEYNWHEQEDNLILGSAILGIATINLLDNNDSLVYDINKLDYDINFIDKTALDNWSPKSASRSDWFLMTNALLPFSLVINSNLSKQKTEIALLYIQSLALNNFITSLTKSSVKRPRPYVYNKNLSLSNRTDKDSQYSFFSGHTSTVFTSSFFIIKVIEDNDLFKKDQALIYTALLSSSVYTAYLRYDAGKHFPSDLLAGAIVGSTVGYFIPELHKNSTNETNAKMLRISITF